MWAFGGYEALLALWRQLSGSERLLQVVLGGKETVVKELNICVRAVVCHLVDPLGSEQGNIYSLLRPFVVPFGLGKDLYLAQVPLDLPYPGPRRSPQTLPGRRKMRK